MKHPLIVFVAAVLSGILIGVRETPPSWRAACLIVTVLAVYKAYRKCRDLKRDTLLFCALFLAAGFSAGLIRASNVSALYVQEDKAEFFRKYRASNPGEFDYALYLKSLGISNEIERKRLKDRDPDPDSKPGVFLYQLNNKAGNVLERYISGHDAGILRAMLLGDKSQMDGEVKDLYQASGISHLLAVSGLHVSMIGMSIFRFLRKKLRSGLGVSVAVSAGTTFVYAVFTGGSGSSLRAAAMLILNLAALYFGRTYDLLTAVSFAAAVLLMWRPYLILQSGFQLSFGAIIGIYAGSKLKEEGILKISSDSSGVIGRLAGTLLSAFMVTMVTLPVAAGNFFSVPLYSVLLNVIVVPLMTIVMVSGILVLFAGILIPAGKTAAFVSSVFMAPGHYILGLYEILCGVSEKLSHSSLLFGKAEPWQSVIYYVLLNAVAAVLTKLNYTGMKRSAAAVTGVALMLMIPITVKHFENVDCYVCAVDVGQGDCFHIHCGNTDILIDGGCSGYEKSGQNIIEPYLLSKGIDELSAVIISHADSDHTNGILYLISDESKINVKKILLPAMGRKDEKYAVFRESGIPVLYSEKGKMIRGGGGMNLKCIYSAVNGPAVTDTNRQSSVYRLDIKGFRMLFTGDITKEDELLIYGMYRDGTELSGIDVLKAAHHGSKTATSDIFIKALKPGYAILSYGEGNRFGHPHAETLETLSENGVKCLETAKSGALTIVINSGGYEICSFIKEGGV